MSKMQIFETHAHYDDEAFDADRESLLGSMNENGIGKIVNDYNIIAGILQLNRGVRTDEASSTGYQDGFFHDTIF